MQIAIHEVTRLDVGEPETLTNDEIGDFQRQVVIIEGVDYLHRPMMLRLVLFPKKKEEADDGDETMSPGGTA